MEPLNILSGGRNWWRAGKGTKSRTTSSPAYNASRRYLYLLLHLLLAPFASVHIATGTKRETTFSLEIERSSLCEITLYASSRPSLLHFTTCDFQFSEETTSTYSFSRIPYATAPYHPPYSVVYFYMAILLRPLERLVRLGVMERNFMEHKKMEPGSDISMTSIIFNGTLAVAAAAAVTYIHLRHLPITLAPLNRHVIY